jgi:hypothetical protein
MSWNIPCGFIIKMLAWKLAIITNYLSYFPKFLQMNVVLGP